MNAFEFKTPYLYKDEPTNKKWCVRYSIRYTGEKNFTPHKEYGKRYFPNSLNLITNLTEREKAFKKLLILVEVDLARGIDNKKPELFKAIIEKRVEESNRLSYDECLKKYWVLKKYDNPIPKKVYSATMLRAFHNNQFRPFLERKGLLGDISLINDDHVLEFLNSYYLHDDVSKRWTNNTFNNKKGFLGSFFAAMKDNKFIKENPLSKVKYQPKESTERFTAFTIEERDLLFDALDKKSLFIGTIAKVIYYAFIRETECGRLKVSDFDLEKRQIRIEADNAKSQKDKLVRFVKITKPLNEALKNYLNHFENKPEWYMFGKKYRPSVIQVGYHWHYLFNNTLDDLKIEHPGKFNRPGLSLYSCKHSGITHFIEQNAAKFSSTQLYSYVQEQCRHETFEMTQRYLRKLEINIETVDLFDFL